MNQSDNLASSKTKTAGDKKLNELTSATFPTNETTLSQRHLLKERNMHFRIEQQIDKQINVAQLLATRVKICSNRQRFYQGWIIAEPTLRKKARKENDRN